MIRVNNLISSEIESSSVIEHVFKKTYEKVFENSAATMYSNMIANNIAATNQQTIQQISAYNPRKAPNFSEDLKPKQIKITPDRPFSAKIQRSFRRKHRQNSIMSFEQKATQRTIIHSNSFKTIKNRGQKSIQDGHKQSHLIPLMFNMEENDQEDKFIQKLRRQKLKTEEYQTKKSKFLKTMNKENQVYGKDQNKFINLFASKEHTYSYSGAMIEVVKSGSKNSMKLKKKTRNQHQMRTWGKKQSDQAIEKENITVDYTGYQNFSQSKAFMLDLSSPNGIETNQMSGNFGFLEKNATKIQYKVIVSDL